MSVGALLLVIEEADEFVAATKTDLMNLNQSISYFREMPSHGDEFATNLR